MSGRVELSGDLEMAVARGPLRQWMDRGLPELQADVMRLAPAAHIWQTMHDDKVRTTHRKANGQAIPANLRFILDKPERGPTVHGQASRAAHHAEGHHGGRTGNIARKPEQFGTEQARYPRDETLSAGNRINCRCGMTVVLGMIAATILTGPVEVAGGTVRGTVGSRFPRIAESEFGNGQDQGVHFMARALYEFAARIQSRA